MSFFNILSNLTQAVVAVAVAPVALVVDVVTLPVSVLDDKEAFKRTEEALTNVSDSLAKAVASITPE
jgi:hypothetical protein